MKKQKSVAATINAALKNGDHASPIIGRDAYAPKAGNGNKTAKTLTQLVKDAQAAAELAKAHTAQSRENMLSSNSNANNAADCVRKAHELCDAAKAMAEVVENRFERSHKEVCDAKWFAAISFLAAIISLLSSLA